MDSSEATCKSKWLNYTINPIPMKKQLIVNLLLLVFSLSLVSCNQTMEHQEEMNKKLDSLIGVTKELNLEFLEEIAPAKKPTPKLQNPILLLVLFDGNCSACIMSFLKSIKNGMPYKADKIIFIAQSQDLLLIEYYMEQNNLTLRSNESLLLDSSNVFSRYNPEIDLSMLPVIKVNSSGKVLSVNSLYEINIESR